MARLKPEFNWVKLRLKSGNTEDTMMQLSSIMMTFPSAVFLGLTGVAVSVFAFLIVAVFVGGFKLCKYSKGQPQGS